MAGVRQISPIYFEVAQNYGASRLDVVTHVVVPGSLPQALAGLRIALNSTLFVTIAVEFVSATRGLGALMWRSRETLRLEELYAGLVVTAVLGLLANAGLASAAPRLVRWHEGVTG
jgi:ABC-type nitrate/sulfonate/bicarbonate transport system permease component